MENAFRWNEWNLDHIQQHAVTREEAEYIVDHAAPPYPEQIGDRKWRVRGQTRTDQRWPISPGDLSLRSEWHSIRYSCAGIERSRKAAVTPETPMSKHTKQKPFWEMTTEELAEATKQFDDPNYDPPAVKPTAKELAQLRRWQRRRDAQRLRLTLLLDKDLVEQTDDYAVNHGITFSEVVSDALRRLIRKKKSA